MSTLKKALLLIAIPLVPYLLAYLDTLPRSFGN